MKQLKKETEKERTENEVVHVIKNREIENVIYIERDRLKMPQKRMSNIKKKGGF